MKAEKKKEKEEQKFEKVEKQMLVAEKESETGNDVEMVKQKVMDVDDQSPASNGSTDAPLELDMEDGED